MDFVSTLLRCNAVFIPPRFTPRPTHGGTVVSAGCNAGARPTRGLAPTNADSTVPYS